MIFICNCNACRQKDDPEELSPEEETALVGYEKGVGVLNIHRIKMFKKTYLYMNLLDAFYAYYS
jgi:hypothetical protein